MNFKFSVNFSILKPQLLFKLIFRATEQLQRPKFGIIQKQLLCTLGSSRNLALNAVPRATG